MTSREQFEAWCNSDPDRSITMEDSTRFFCAWEAWQASREAVSVEIPENKLLSSSILKPNAVYGLKRKEVIECVRAAGIKVKGE